MYKRQGLLRFKAALWGTGVERVAGVDEAGMSPMIRDVAIWQQPIVKGDCKSLSIGLSGARASYGPEAVGRLADHRRMLHLLGGDP